MANDNPAEILVNIGGHIYPLDLSEELENGFCSQSSQQGQRVQTADKWTNTEPLSPQPDPPGVTAYTVLNGSTNKCDTPTVDASPASVQKPDPPGVATYTVITGSTNECSRTAVHASLDSAQSLVNLLYQQETDEHNLIPRNTTFSNSQQQQVLKPMENITAFDSKNIEVNMNVDEKPSVEETSSYNVSDYRVQSVESDHILDGYMVQREHRTDGYMFSDMFPENYSNWNKNVNGVPRDTEGVEQLNTRKHDIGYCDLVNSCLDIKPFLSTSVYEDHVDETGSLTISNEKVSTITRTNSRRYGKKSERGCKIWEFIRNLLLDPTTNPSLICWENHQEGTFRLIQPRTISAMWGLKKGNQYMNYEKLSRAMRYHYKKNVLAPVKGKNLIYRFGPGATGWK